jgi:Fe-S-cluster containining protein
MADLVQIERIKKREFNARVVELTNKRRVGYREPQLPLDRLSKFRADRVSVDKDAPVPECTTCGVCCFLPLIVPVTRAESERLTNYCDILLDDSDEDIVVDRMLPRAGDGRCVNLEGKLGVNIGCRIYEERPHVCRDFDAGSDRCHEYRRMFDIENQLTETQVETASKLLQQQLMPELIEDVSIVSTGSIERSSYNVTDGTVEYTKAQQLSIVAFLNDDDEPLDLHTFESGVENWFESDFVGLTVDDARQLINERAGW